MHLLYKNVFVVALCIVIGTLFGSYTVHATVGGPIYVGNFTYNPADESVYYVKTVIGGRGCPPILQKLSLATEEMDTLISCSDGFEINEQSGTPPPSVNQEIQKITSDFKDLIAIDLPQSDIEVDVSYVSSTDDSVSPFTTFEATVFQNGEPVDSFTLKGCTKEQPFMFGGYAIPGFEQKIVMVSSGIGTCFEGGYTEEDIYVVSGLQNITEEVYDYSFKSSQDPLALNENTLVVYEKDSIETPDPSPATSTASTEGGTNSTSQNEGYLNSPAIIVLSALLIALISLIAGFMFGVRRGRLSSMR